MHFVQCISATGSETDHQHDAPTTMLGFKRLSTIPLNIPLLVAVAKHLELCLIKPSNFYSENICLAHMTSRTFQSILIVLVLVQVHTDVNLASLWTAIWVFQQFPVHGVLQPRWFLKFLTNFIFSNRDSLVKCLKFGHNWIFQQDNDPSS
ncbi:hypothetical protein AMECASPLE_016242 [Ameca splendens]|uniref:Uncharacterized protein n=1 Tax=Ameca splendens TaxID=208324 RepID=A0ABV0YDD6_9TELE